MPLAVIAGAGIIGSSWALVFARAGWNVRIVSRHAEVRETVKERIRRAAELARAIRPDVTPDTIVQQVEVADQLATACRDATWIQESIEERMEAKRALLAQLDAAAPPEAIIASSTSSIPMSRMAEGLSGAARCLVAHPASPPHLIPVVEIAPSSLTTNAVTERACDVMRTLGQVPVLVRKEQPGFVMNRLQGALLIEMMAAVRDGVMSVEDVDALIRDGFALRWAWLGPFEGVDLNAPGGIADYLHRYGFMFDAQAAERGGQTPVVTPDIVEQLHDAMRRRTPLGALPERTAWRDARMAALRALRVELT